MGTAEPLEARNGFERLGGLRAHINQAQCLLITNNKLGRSPTVTGRRTRDVWLGT